MSEVRDTPSVPDLVAQATEGIGLVGHNVTAWAAVEALAALAEAREPYVEFVEACLEIEARSRDPWTEIRNRLQDFKDDDLWPSGSRSV